MCILYVPINIGPHIHIICSHVGTPGIKHLNLQTLEHRRLITDLSLCYKIIPGLISLDFHQFFQVFVQCNQKGSHL